MNLRMKHLSCLNIRVTTPLRSRPGSPDSDGEAIDGTAVEMATAKIKAALVARILTLLSLEIRAIGQKTQECTKRAFAFVNQGSQVVQRNDAVPDCVVGRNPGSVFEPRNQHSAGSARSRG